jgi:hypothetical protein
MLIVAIPIFSGCEEVIGALEALDKEFRRRTSPLPNIPDLSRSVLIISGLQQSGKSLSLSKFVESFFIKRTV